MCDTFSSLSALTIFSKLESAIVLSRWAVARSGEPGEEACLHGGGADSGEHTGAQASWVLAGSWLSF